MPHGNATEDILRSFTAGATLGRDAKSLFTKGGTPRQLAQDQQFRRGEQDFRAGQQRSQIGAQNLQKGAQALRRGDREFERFAQEDNIRSVAIGALKALSLDPVRRDAFLRKRIQEGLAVGKDMSDTIEVFAMGPGEEQDEALKGAIEIGSAVGAIAPQRGITPKAGKIVPGLDPTTKKPVMLLVDPVTGKTRVLPFLPPPKGGGPQLRVTGPDGNVIEFGQGGLASPDAPELDKKTRRDIEGSLVRGARSLSSLEAISKKVDDEFLTYKGSIRAGLSKLKDKLGITLTPDEKRFLASRKRFMVQVNQIFNAYRKEITGAAASVQELEGLKESVINGDLGPTEFRATLAEMVDKTRRLQRLQRKILRDGVRGQAVRGRDFRKEGTEAALDLDNLFLNGLDDDPEAREAELIAKGFTPKQAIQKMIEEGF